MTNYFNQIGHLVILWVIFSKRTLVYEKTTSYPSSPPLTCARLIFFVWRAARKRREAHVLSLFLKSCFSRKQKNEGCVSSPQIYKQARTHSRKRIWFDASRSDGDEGSRTLVQKYIRRSFYERSLFPLIPENPSKQTKENLR